MVGRLAISLTLLFTIAANPAPSRVEQLLKELASDEWKAREQAQSELVRLGEDARPQLLRLRSATTDDDLRTRLDAVLRRIEDEARFGPTLLTLRFKEAPLKDVLAEIGCQAGVEMRLSTNAGAKVTIQCQREPFWQVIRQLCEDNNLAPNVDGRRRAITLQPGPWHFRPGAVAGPIMVCAGQLTRSTMLDLAEGSEPDRSSTLELHFFIDPRLRVLRFSSDVHLDQAVDEHGQSYVEAAVEPAPLAFNSMGTPMRWSTQVDLAEPARAGKKLARLHGSLRLVVPSRTETAEVAIGARATAAVAGRRFAAGEVRKSGEQFVASISFYRGIGGREEWRQTLAQANLRQSVKLVDREGRAFELRTVAGGAGDLAKPESTVNLTFSRPRDASGRIIAASEPARLLVTMPTEVKEILAPFVLTDVELP